MGKFEMLKNGLILLLNVLDNKKYLNVRGLRKIFLFVKTLENLYKKM